MRKRGACRRSSASSSRAADRSRASGSARTCASSRAASSMEQLVPVLARRGEDAVRRRDDRERSERRRQRRLSKRSDRRPWERTNAGLRARGTAPSASSRSIRSADGLDLRRARAARRSVVGHGCPDSKLAAHALQIRDRVGRERLADERPDHGAQLRLDGEADPVVDHPDRAVGRRAGSGRPCGRRCSPRRRTAPRAGTRRACSTSKREEVLRRGRS